MTKKRRYLISATVLVSCVGIALGVLAMLPPRPGVTKANFDRIEEGMTQAAVSEIFGKEPSLSSGRAPTNVNFFGIDVWSRDDGTSARIVFHNNSATGMEWTESTEALPDKLRRWLHLPK